MFAHFHARVTGGEESPLSEPLAEEMERLEPLTGVKAYPARVKCATLSWHALEAALKGRWRNGEDGVAGMTERDPFDFDQEAATADAGDEVERPEGARTTRR